MIENAQQFGQQAKSYEGYATYPASNASVADTEMERLLAGRYVIETQMGHSGEVFRAINPSGGRRVVVKRLSLDTASDWKDFEVFEREAKILTKINIPGTPKICEWIQEKNNKMPMSLLVLEYIEGKTLEEFIEKDSRFHFSVTCQLLIQLLDIIKALHQHQPPVHHRNLCPANIVLRYDDQKYAEIPEVFVIDFDAAANTNLSQAASLGTSGYMAPELLTGNPEAASDIYSFGAIAFYLFSGTSPEDVQIIDSKLAIEPHMAHLPTAVCQFLKQLLDPNPQQRLSDYDKIRAMLEMFSEDTFLLEFLDAAGQGEEEYKLENVKTIMQPGNITLWQQLPENTPRKIPDPYRKMINRDVLLCKIAEQDQIIAEAEAKRAAKIDKKSENQKKQAQKQQWMKYAELAASLGFKYYLRKKLHIDTRRSRRKRRIRKTPYQPKFVFKRDVNHPLCVNINARQFKDLRDTPQHTPIVTSFAHGIGICFLAVCAWNTYYYGSLIHEKVMWIMLGIYAFLMLISGLSIWEEIRKSYKVRNEYSDLLEKCLIEGKKDIARVEKIELLSTAKNVDQAYGLANLVSGEAPIVGKINQKLNEQVRPLWRVTYTFKPTNDPLCEPVSHVYYSETYIDKSKIGQSLPILHGVHENKIYSMPYPLPPNSSILYCRDFVSIFNIKLRSLACKF